MLSPTLASTTSSEPRMLSPTPIAAASRALEPLSRAAPPAPTTLVTVASTTAVAHQKATSGSKRAPRSTRRPATVKKIGAKKLSVIEAIDGSTSRMAPLLLRSTSAATNAPRTASIPAALVKAETAKMTTSATATGPCAGPWRRAQSSKAPTTRGPHRTATTASSTMEPIARTRSATGSSPVPASEMTTPSRIQPATSLVIATARVTWAKSLRSWPASASTRLMTGGELIESAIAMNSTNTPAVAEGPRYTSGSTPPRTAPAAKGMTRLATARAGTRRLHRRTSLGSVWKPVTASTIRAEIDANPLRGSDRSGGKRCWATQSIWPRPDGPMSTPAAMWPSTDGCPIRRASAPKSSAAAMSRATCAAKRVTSSVESDGSGGPPKPGGAQPAAGSGIRRTSRRSG